MTFFQGLFSKNVKVEPESKPCISERDIRNVIEDNILNDSMNVIESLKILDIVKTGSEFIYCENGNDWYNYFDWPLNSAKSIDMVVGIYNISILLGNNIKADQYGNITINVIGKNKTSYRLVLSDYESSNMSQGRGVKIGLMLPSIDKEYSSIFKIARLPKNVTDSISDVLRLITAHLADAVVTYKETKEAEELIENNKIDSYLDLI